MFKSLVCETTNEVARLVLYTPFFFPPDCFLLLEELEYVVQARQ